MMGDDFVKPVHSFLCNLIIVQFIFVIYRTLVLRRPKLNNFSIFFFVFVYFSNGVYSMSKLCSLYAFIIVVRLLHSFLQTTNCPFQLWYVVRVLRTHRELLQCRTKSLAFKKTFLLPKNASIQYQKKESTKKKFELIIVQTHTGTQCQTHST